MPLDQNPEPQDAALRTVVEAVATLLDADEDTLTAGTALPAVDGWDSVNQLRVLVCLERELGCPLDYERFAAAGTIGDLADLVADTPAVLPGGRP